ncbi:MAG TPA: PEP-CTERM sorting domain-containing protein [Candidatus Methylacidiphilales bacterium]
MKKRNVIPALALFLLGLGAPALRADTAYNIDFNTTAGGAYPAGTGTWNSYGTVAATTGFLLDSTGAASGIGISLSGTVQASSRSGTTDVYNNTAGNNPAWVASASANGAAGDYFYTNNSDSTQDSFQVAFTGLTLGAQVSVNLFASRNDTGATGYYSYSVDGGTTWIGLTVYNYDGTAAASWTGQNTLTKIFDETSDGYTNHEYMGASGIAIGSSGLLVKVSDTATGPGIYSTLNAMQLSVAAVPEPGTWALLGLSAACAGIVLASSRPGNRRPGGSGA